MEQSPQHLRANASKCRELADSAVTEDGRSVLAALAVEYEQTADALERSAMPPARRQPMFRWALR